MGSDDNNNEGKVPTILVPSGKIKCFVHPRGRPAAIILYVT